MEKVRQLVTRMEVWGTGLLLLVVAGLWLAVAVSGGDAVRVVLPDVLAAPSAVHWLGADDLGRDVLARLAGGVRVSLLVGLAVLAITVAIGVPLGLVAGWYGGWADKVILKVTEVVLSFPGLLLALALAALLGGGMATVMLALGVLGWVGFCRLTRVQVQKLRQLAFLEAAQLAGVPTWKTWLRHVLPNCAAPLVVEALLVVAGSMVAEAGLSFLGLGLPPELPSLGGMLRDGTRLLLVAPLLVVYPAVVLIGLTVGVNMVAEGLRRRVAGGNEGAA
ncbi:MAG: ABC transporter permease subunit [Proteobacteria bacterium]|nr:ABC transporter permease subunit [Pseudomonadota bacterium]